MEYKEKCGGPWPGHVVFLIDQSGSMSIQCGSMTRLELAQNCITKSINDIILGCVSGEDFSNRCYISVIGYGKKGDSVELIRHGWASEWEDDVMSCKYNGKPLFTLECTDGWTPMAGAFNMAKELLEAWHEKIKREIANPKASDPTKREKPIIAMGLPIVINITDGCKEDFEQVPGYLEEVMNSAVNLMNTYDNDGGKVFLFNAHMGDGQEIKFPIEKSLLAGNYQTEFLFDISSELTSRMAQSAAHIFVSDNGAKIGAGCKGLVANAQEATLTRFIEFGSNISNP